MGSMSSTPDATRATPLQGIAVLDLTRVLSGPHCTRMLADLGADVIKLEPPAGDLTRFSTPRRHGIASYFAQQNAGKRNISVDLSSETGIGIVLDLAGRVDVVLENYRPGVMDRLGLGADVLMARNPRLIVASISGYGQDGPWVHRRAYAPVVEAETGIIASQGRKRGELAKDPHSHADLYTALQASSAILAALYQRTQTGVGQRIDVSMAETMMYDNEHMHDALWDGETDPGWIRSFQPDDYVVLTVANGESLIVSGHPAERGTFDLFAAAMGRDDLVDEERFATVESRLAHMDELTAIIADFAASVADPTTFEEIFAQHRLAVGRVRAPGELADTEWGRERNVTVGVDDRHGGSIAVPNVPWRFSAAPGVSVEPTVRYRGEDNRQVLAELLGYDTERIDALEREGVLSSRIPDTAR